MSLAAASLNPKPLTRKPRLGGKRGSAKAWTGSARRRFWVQGALQGSCGLVLDVFRVLGSFGEGWAVQLRCNVRAVLAVRILCKAACHTGMLESDPLEDGSCRLGCRPPLEPPSPYTQDPNPETPKHKTPKVRLCCILRGLDSRLLSQPTWHST